MSPELRDLVKYQLDRAEEAFEEAELLFNNRHLYTALSRCYYAAFYAVSSWLLMKELSSSKHSGIRSLFNQHMVHTNIITNDWGDFYNRLFDFRQKADYEYLVTFEVAFVEDCMNKTREFVALIINLVKEQLTHN